MANQTLAITTPNGTLIKQVKDGVTMNVRIDWSPDFAPRATSALQKTQFMFDQECARLMDKYVPFRTGMLKGSVITASNFGSGELIYNTPYARAQYYRRPSGTDLRDGIRGSYWGHRMIADNKTHLERFASKTFGGEMG